MDSIYSEAGERTRHAAGHGRACRRSQVVWSAVSLALLWASPGARAETVDPGPESNLRDDHYYTEATARARVYGEVFGWRDTVLRIDSVRRAGLYDQTRLRESRDSVRLVYAVDAEGNRRGMYGIASEIGKHQYFEFLVGLDSALRIKDIVVLTYRESRGAEVRRERFTRQYRGKSVTSPIRLNRDILSIAGATMSSMAVNRGVKKVLWWAHEAWPQEGAAE